MEMKLTWFARAAAGGAKFTAGRRPQWPPQAFLEKFSKRLATGGGIIPRRHGADSFGLPDVEVGPVFINGSTHACPRRGHDVGTGQTVEPPAAPAVTDIDM